MKYVYCEDCDKAYLKSRIERGKCMYCGKASQIVDVDRSRNYYLGYGIMVLGAALMVIIRFFFFNLWLLWTFGIAFLVVGGYVIIKANGQMAVEARRTALGDKVSETTESEDDQ